jgi:hypothetical protein
MNPMRASLVLLLSLAAAAVLRLVPAIAVALAIATPLAVAAFVASAMAALTDDERRRALGRQFVLIGLIAATTLVGLWPCDVACQGGAPYQYLFHIPVACLAVGAAVIGLALVRVASWRIAAAWAFVLVGGSLYYLYLSWRIGLVCPYCLAVHGAIIPLAGLAFGRAAGRMRQALVFAPALLAFALLAIGYRIDRGPVVEDGPPVGVVQPGTGDVAAVEHGRSLGAEHAPLVADLVIDFQCPVCARIHGDLMQALAPAIDSGRVEVVMRNPVHRGQPLSSTLARWALAAAAIDRESHTVVVAAMLGLKGDARETDARAKLAELADVVAIDRSAAAHEAAITKVLRSDQERLHEIDQPQTPVVVLHDRATGKELGRWHGEFEIADLVAAVGR